ncbi:MAG: hypothetical protein JO356_16015, partial [Acidobacteria bacterium]|nr:hypothetical protein [Acidobacteriota bacterium]
MRHALSSFTVMMLGLISAPSLGIRMSAETPTPSFYTYLLRLEHASADSHTCSLLKSTGDFHLEVEGGDQTRVFEGQLSPSQLLSLEKVLNDPMMQNLSQEQIEEPLMSEERDTFQIDIFRKDHWQNLFFRSNESQARFEHALAPLRRWLARVEKLPHRELSEDEGKNNCLPPKKLILKRRAPSLTESPHRPEAYSAAPILLPRATNGKSLSSSMLLGMLSFRVLGSGAQQSCALIANDGQYRFEHRVQASAR